MDGRPRSPQALVEIDQGPAGERRGGVGHNARSQSHREGVRDAGQDDELGEPLTIAKVAALLGCSIWTVRHRLLPAGLPHFQANPPNGKYVFFERQVRAWILARQQEGGKTRRGFI